MTKPGDLIELDPLLMIAMLDAWPENLMGGCASRECFKLRFLARHYGDPALCDVPRCHHPVGMHVLVPVSRRPPNPPRTA